MSSTSVSRSLRCPRSFLAGEPSPVGLTISRQILTYRKNSQAGRSQGSATTMPSFPGERQYKHFGSHEAPHWLALSIPVQVIRSVMRSWSLALPVSSAIPTSSGPAMTRFHAGSLASVLAKVNECIDSFLRDGSGPLRSPAASAQTRPSRKELLRQQTRCALRSDVPYAQTVSCTGIGRTTAGQYLLLLRRLKRIISASCRIFCSTKCQ